MERLALQTLLKIGDGATPTEGFTTVLDVMDLSAPGISLDTEELTNHSQTDFYRKFGGTLLDAGEVSATVLYDPANATHVALVTDIQARTLRNFLMEFPGATTNARWSFSGFITQFQPETPTDAHLKASITIKITGSISIADNS
jgi:Lambda phage tail tube protein, TTP